MAIELSLSPVQVELSTSPGKNLTQVYYLENKSDQPITVDISLKSWLPNGPQGSVSYLPENPTSIKFSLNNADLSGMTNIPFSPRQKRQLVLGIYPDQSTQTGDYYFTVLFNQKSAPSLGQTSSSTTATLGSHLLLSLANTKPSPAAKLEKLTINTLFVDPLLPPPIISGLIQNTSPHFFKISGQLVISRGDQKQYLPLAPEIVASRSSRELLCLEIQSEVNAKNIPCRLPSNTLPGFYQISLELDPSIKLTNNFTLRYYNFPIILMTILLTPFLVYLIFKAISHKLRGLKT